MRVLVTGASGCLGGWLVRALLERGEDVLAWSGTQCGSVEGLPLRPVDLSNPGATARAFEEAEPDVVIHAAAVSRTDRAHGDPELAVGVNTGGTARMAGMAGRDQVRFIHVSTDLVFDGEGAPYREGDEERPLSIYGKTKLAAEGSVREIPNSVVVRVSLMYGPSRERGRSFFDFLLESLRAGSEVRPFLDEWRTPLSLRYAAEGLAMLVRSDETGLFHLGGPERLSRMDMATRLKEYLGIEEAKLVTASRLEGSVDELRPKDVSLDSSRWIESFSELVQRSYEEELSLMGVG